MGGDLFVLVIHDTLIPAHASIMDIVFMLREGMNEIFFQTPPESTTIPYFTLSNHPLTLICIMCCKGTTI